MGSICSCFMLLSSWRRTSRFTIGKRLITNSSPILYDLAVIGGGSGGLACAREAKRVNRESKVALIDYVSPSPHGSKWGLGGCCVNVGCIPKKLMHHAALLKQYSVDAKEYGWKGVDDSNLSLHHDWSTLVSNVQGVIRGMNWSYRTALRDEGIDYYNAIGSFMDKNTLKLEIPNKSTNSIQASNILIAVGGRPKYLDIPGSELSISSDDLFTLSSPPGKTLLIGGGYVALECAGFLTEFGYDVSVMARGQLLRGFDQQMAGMIQDNLTSIGTKFLQDSRPQRISKLPNNKLEVEWLKGTGEGKTRTDTFDTVVMAVGRTASTAALGLKNADIEIDKTTGKIIVNDEDRTTTSDIYAIGDVAVDRPELTPPAIKAGQLLARRIFKKSSKLMDYENIATTVFTPLEYGCVGLSEEEAIKTFGSENIEILHAKYDTLEIQGAHRTDHKGDLMSAICYTKVIYEKKEEEADGKILGVHVFGPNAGEVVQGFALAVKLKATRGDVEDLVGIHPTHAEEIVLLNKSKSKNEDPTKKGC